MSGLIIRGPHHPKSPTDKINYVSIELLKKGSSKEETIVKIMYKGLILQTKEFYVLIRQNSIKKDDPTYLMFVQNALFVPINLFGALTLDNPNVRATTNMFKLIKQSFSECHLWVRERYTEGVVMALIGDSRDEGYFAVLRKTFLVLFAARRGNQSATWDIDAFCKKTNECLIDNPLSLYFHKTLMSISQRSSRPIGRERSRDVILMSQVYT